MQRWRDHVAGEKLAHGPGKRQCKGANRSSHGNEHKEDTDGTSAVARAAGATVVFEPVNPIGRARDAGARAATGEWLVFIDADSTPSAELFASIATRIAEGRALGGGSTVELEPGTPSLAAPLILPEETKARKSWSWRKVTFIVIILCYVFLE